MWNWLFRRVVFGIPFRHRVRAEIIGRENLPEKGGYILAMGSHTTELESAIVAVWLHERQFHFYAKAEYWRKGWLVRWFMNVAGQIPVERNDARKALEAIEAGAEVLRHGGVLAVYPEGTRSTDGKLHGAYGGTARTLIQAGGTVPIVPVGLIGMEAVSPPDGGFWPQCCSVKIVIGEPIYLSNLEQRALAHGKGIAKGVVSRHVSQEMMKEISRLCGKPYVKDKLPIPSH